MATYNGIKKIKIGDNIFNLYDSGNSGGTITSVKTTAGAHTTINVTSGAANFNVPTKTSHLTNDSGFLTSHQTAVTSLTTTAGSHSTVSSKTGAVSIAIPTKTSHLTNDSGFITNAGVTSITTSSGAHTTKSSATGAVSFNVPTKTSHLTNDSNFITPNYIFVGATSSVGGSAGLIPAPAAGDTQKVVFGDGIWWDIGLTSYYNLDGDVQIQLYRSRSASGGAGVTTESLGLATLIPAATTYAGLMSAADKAKLDRIGTMSSASSSTAITTANINTYAIGPSLTLPSAGVYLIRGMWQFNSATGARTIDVDIAGDNSTAASTTSLYARERVTCSSGAWSRLEVMTILTVTGSTPVYLKGSATLTSAAQSCYLYYYCIG